mmetsp:Transcript_51474/g.115622  ORF Transcript_51474/g.115622 Transcript_51474/m.115622 type:complete len:226 (+) Transcript_51474:673-1350(+)
MLRPYPSLRLVLEISPRGVDPVPMVHLDPQQLLAASRHLRPARRGQLEVGDAGPGAIQQLGAAVRCGKEGEEDVGDCMVALQRRVVLRAHHGGDQAHLDALTYKRGERVARWRIPPPSRCVLGNLGGDGAVPIGPNRRASAIACGAEELIVRPDEVERRHLLLPAEVCGLARGREVAVLACVGVDNAGRDELPIGLVVKAGDRHRALARPHECDAPQVGARRQPL